MYTSQDEASQGCTEIILFPTKIIVVFSACLNPCYTSYQKESIVMQYGRMDVCHSTGTAARRYCTALSHFSWEWFL